MSGFAKAKRGEDFAFESGDFRRWEQNSDVMTAVWLHSSWGLLFSIDLFLFVIYDWFEIVDKFCYRVMAAGVVFYQLWAKFLTTEYYEYSQDVESYQVLLVKQRSETWNFSGKKQLEGDSSYIRLMMGLSEMGHLSSGHFIREKKLKISVNLKQLSFRSIRNDSLPRVIMSFEIACRKTANNVCSTKHNKFRTRLG